MKYVKYAFYATLVFLLLVLVYSAFNTPLLGEDEPLYLWYGKQIVSGNFPSYRNGNPFIQPPVMPLIYGLFGGGLNTAKAINAVFAVLTVIVVYLIGKQTSEYFGMFSALMLLIPSYFTHFSLLVYVEIPIMFFSALSVYFITRPEKNPFVLGLALGLSFYIKFSGLLLVLASFVYGAIKKDEKILKAVLIAWFIIALFGARNILLYGHPYIYGTELFLPIPENVPDWVAEVTPQVSINLKPLDFINLISFPLFVVFTMGISYWISNRDELTVFEKNLLDFSAVVISLFTAVFVFLAADRGVDPRYFTMIFPQIAVFAGFWLYKFKNWNKFAVVIIVPLLLYGAYNSWNTAVYTSNSVRYSQEYINALNWIKANTAEDAVVYTVMCGSASYYSDRKCAWGGERFPEIMHSSDAEFVKSELKDMNVTHILLVKNLVSQDIVIPNSNWIGVFTWDFVNLVGNSNLFDKVYQNTETAVVSL